MPFTLTITLRTLLHPSSSFPQKSPNLSCLLSPPLVHFTVWHTISPSLAVHCKPPFEYERPFCLYLQTLILPTPNQPLPRPQTCHFYALLPHPILLPVKKKKEPKETFHLVQEDLNSINILCPFILLSLHNP